MPISSAVRRLLRIRELREEQSRSDLENALHEMQQLRSALDAARSEAARSRAAIRESLRCEKPVHRIAGLAEEEIAHRHAAALADQAQTAEERAAEQRELFLARRIERRQVESLVHHGLDEEAREDARRNQSSLDEWFRFRS